MSVPVTGTITPYAGGVYPVIDPIYGIDGWRSVADHAARNAIVTATPLRCREGMIVWTQNDDTAWYLNTATPAGTNADWTEFAGGSGSTITLSGDASGTGTSAITVTISSYDGGTTFGTMAHQDASAVAITGGTITGLPSPTSGSDAATKTYVDSLATGLSPRVSCRVATTAALTATYSNGTAGVGATLTNSSTQAAISIDGVSLSSTDRVLVKDQAAPAQNGIYTVTTVGSGATNWVLTRATDYDSAGASEVVAGSYTVIVAGTANAETLWVETGVGPFTIGTTPIVFNQLAAAGIVTVLTGDVTGTGLGAVTTTIAALAVTTGKIAAGAVTYAKLQNEAATSLLGNPTGSPASPSEITLGAGLSFSGTTLVSTGTGGTVTSVATGTGLTGGPITTTGTVSLATITSHNVLANTTSGTAAPAGVTLTSLIDSAISGTQGVILFRGSSAWSALAPGSNGNVLTTHGAAADPTWGTAGGAGTVTSVATGAGLTGGPITATGTIAFAAIANNTILANVSGGSLAPSATTPSAVLDVIGATQGDILYRGSGGWSVLTPGTDGDVLTTHGAAANPTWEVGGGGGSGTVTSITAGTGITLTPSPITTTGSVALTVPVAVTSGGTGIVSYVPGDLLYASGSTSLGRIAGNTTTTKQYLSQTGSGGVAQLPVWSDVTGPRIFTFVLGATSSVGVATDVTNWLTASFAATCTRCDINAKTAPTGASLIVDILKSTDSGSTFTSLWNSTPSNRPTITTGNHTGSTTSFDTTAIAQGDLLRIDVIQVGSMIPGASVTVELASRMAQ